MKKSVYILGAILVSIILLAGCTQQRMSRSYTNSAYGFSCNPPAGWQVVETKSADVAVWFAPGNSSNVSLVFAVPFSLSEGRAISTFADQVEENLSVSGLNYTVIHRDWRTIPGVQAYEISYSYEQGGAVMNVKQVAILKTRTVFLVTFTAPSALYSYYLMSVNQSIDSFL
jgi:hypothetical protein